MKRTNTGVSTVTLHYSGLLYICSTFPWKKSLKLSFSTNPLLFYLMKLTTTLSHYSEMCQMYRYFIILLNGKTSTSLLSINLASIISTYSQSTLSWKHKVFNSYTLTWTFCCFWGMGLSHPRSFSCFESDFEKTKHNIFTCSIPNISFLRLPNFTTKSSLWRRYLLIDCSVFCSSSFI